MTSPTPPSAPIAATAVVPPHKDAGQLSPQQLRIARTRIAVEQLALLAQDMEACPASVRQAVCRALEAILELQGLLQAQRGVETQESRHG